MQRIPGRWIGAAAAVLFAGARPAAAEKAGPVSARAFVEAQRDRVAAVLAGPPEGRGAAIAAAVAEVFDYDGLPRRCFDVRWEEMTEAQRASVSAALRRLVERRFESWVEASSGAPTLTIAGEGTEGELVRVSGRVAVGAEEVEVAVDLVSEGGAWRAVDVWLDGQGLVDSFRRQFRTYLADHAMSELVRRLHAKAFPPDPPSRRDSIIENPAR